jgi:hypothetical protein
LLYFALAHVQELTAIHKRYVKELPLANPQDIFTNGEIRHAVPPLPSSTAALSV